MARIFTVHNPAPIRFWIVGAGEHFDFTPTREQRARAVQLYRETLDRCARGWLGWGDLHHILTGSPHHGMARAAVLALKLDA